MRAAAFLALAGVVALLCLPVGGMTSGTVPGAPPHAPPAAAAAFQDVSSIYVWSSLSPVGGNLSGGVYLYVPANSTGVLVYPVWHAVVTSSAAAPYAVYVGGLEIASGSVLGTKTLAFNVTGPTVTVLIGFAGVTYQYRDETVASVSVQQYYGSTPSPLVYTAQEFEQALTTAQAQEYAVVILAFTGSFFMARKWAILNKKAQASRVL